MFTDFLNILADWSQFDSWIVVCAALAAGACAIPGCFLVLRRQSLMGDALSHTVLPGIAGAFLLSHGLMTSGWMTPETYESTWHLGLFAGAISIGILTALLTQFIQNLGGVESSAALGIVFTTLFAIGLVMIRMAADQVDLDPDCVLYGAIESSILDTVGTTDIPRAAVVNGAVLVLNLLLVVVFYKELRISAFDPELATTLGINAQVMHYGLMAATAVTLVAAFESVGSILVIAMLIVPAATAFLLTHRLHVMIGLSLVVGAVSALLGHVLAMTLPTIVTKSWGGPSIQGTSTAGMIAAASGACFFLAVLLSPRQGVLSLLIARQRLRLRIVAEDVLGLLIRLEESEDSAVAQTASQICERLGTGRLKTRLAIIGLTRQQRLASSSDGVSLTERGRSSANRLVRSHRLWESYMAKHFVVPDDHLHETASRVEHFLDPDLREELAEELDAPETDPHGRAIPPESESK